jgi:hypothetical protein
MFLLSINRPYKGRSATTGPLASSGAAAPVRLADHRPPPDINVDLEADEIAWALEISGPLTRTELFGHTGARNWGPGRFSRALHTALGRGQVRRVRHRYERV